MSAHGKENEMLHEFCDGLCSDEKSKVICRQLVDIPADICRRILEDFSTMTLSKKIHPIREDDIYMASHKSYRAYMRNERSVVGKAVNESTVNVLREINAFLSGKRNGGDLAQLIKIHLNFPPSRLFMTNLDHHKCQFKV